MRVKPSAGLFRLLWHLEGAVAHGRGVSIEEISLLVGHDGADTTERVYDRRLRSARRSAATAMNEILHDLG